MSRRALRAMLLLVALAGPVGAQTPTDVRIDISSGEGRRIRVHCEALQSAGDRNASSWAAQADEVLAHDLDWSAVFTVSRAWIAGQQPVEVQAVVGGRLAVSGERWISRESRKSSMRPRGPRESGPPRRIGGGSRSGSNGGRPGGGPKKSRFVPRSIQGSKGGRPRG